MRITSLLLVLAIPAAFTQAQNLAQNLDVISPGDIVVLTFSGKWGPGPINKVLLVSGDGKLTLPWVEGTMPAETALAIVGLTLDEASERLQQDYAQQTTQVRQGPKRPLPLRAQNVRIERGTASQLLRQ
jgi:hypothetical protein